MHMLFVSLKSFIFLFVSLQALKGGEQCWHDLEKRCCKLQLFVLLHIVIVCSFVFFLIQMAESGVLAS